MPPERTCIGCRQRDMQDNLRRLIRRGELVIDATAPRLPGRGAYVHEDCLDLAVRRHGFRRAFGPSARPDPGLWRD